MGNYNSYYEGGSYLSSEAKTRICILINAVYFFLESVFIVVEKDQYRLVVIHNRKLIVDERYDTIRGAKIAFYRMYKEKACAKGLRNEWSANYEPDKRWLSRKLEAKPQLLNKAS
jgi:hypothetical protein